VPAAAVVVPPDLAGDQDALVGRIGLGRQRQLAFACAVAHDPALLVLDEPTSGVNPLARARLWDRIHERADRGVGVLVTTHHLQEAQQCDRLIVMASGRGVVAGTLAEVLAGRTAVLVDAPSWSEAFAALSDAGSLVTLAGTRVRVADRSPDEVRAILAAASVEARVDVVPASLDETMVLVAAPPPGT
jgi:ABC-type multidrug transport system ATPase subunit